MNRDVDDGDVSHDDTDVFYNHGDVSHDGRSVSCEDRDVPCEGGTSPWGVPLVSGLCVRTLGECAAGRYEGRRRANRRALGGRGADTLGRS
jgi:hypothetical protein